MLHFLTLMGLFLFQTLTAEKTGPSEPVYKAVGDQVVLTPDSVDGNISSIMWKHGSDIAVLWDGGETVSYRQFKGRTVLNSSTGALTITGLTRSDSGSYVVEINDRVTNRIHLQVISRVPKPSVSTWCDPEMTHCVFTCEGNTTDAGPVTYEWKASAMTWPSTNVLYILRDEMELWFQCILKNPVSFSISDSVVNPLARDRILRIIGVCVGLISLLCLLFILCRIGMASTERRRTREMRQERSEMLPNGHEIPLTSVVSHDTNNATELQEKLIQDSTSPDAGDETENNPAAMSRDQEALVQEAAEDEPPSEDEQPAEDPQDKDQI